MRLFKIILAVVVLVLTFLLFRQNLDVLNHQVQFKLNLGLFSFQSVSHPLWVILAFTLFIGILGYWSVQPAGSPQTAPDQPSITP